jgi:hypothetical protein
MRRRWAFTESEKTEIWDRIGAGQTPASVAAVLGRYPSAIRALQQASGVRPERRRSRWHGRPALPTVSRRHPTLQNTQNSGSRQS